MKRTLIIIFLFQLISCASPQKHFSKGNYQKAFDAALNDLQKKNDRKLKQILNRSFEEIVRDKSYRIDNLSASRHLEDWEDAFALYQELINDYDDGHRFLLPKYDTIIDKLIDENELLALLISDRFEEMAFNSMEDYERHYDKFAAQSANRYFNKILYYEPDYPGIDSLLDYSYLAGVINYLVDVNTWDFTYQFDIDQEFSQLRNKSWGYYQVFYNTIISNVDCEIDLNFQELSIIETASQTHSERFTKEIQDGYKTVTDTSGVSSQVPRYIEVEGFVSTLATTKNYEWRINMMVDRYSDYCNISGRTFTSIKSLTKNEYELSGDERAIPGHYKNTGSAEYDHSDRKIAKDMIRDLYRQVSNHLNIR